MPADAICSSDDGSETGQLRRIDWQAMIDALRLNLLDRHDAHESSLGYYRAEIDLPR